MVNNDQVRVRVHSGRFFRDFYTNRKGADDWACNKMMELEENEPDVIYERYEILSDDRVSPAAALGSIKSPRKAASSRENGKKGGRPTQKWTKARIKRALDVIDTRVKFHSISTEVSQIQDDASFLSVYRKTDIPVNTIDEFIEYTEMSRTKEIDFLFNALNKK